ncbi:hypothetical protein N0V91_010241 [Didymella pomorum]|uniref:Uncharacterized protein n=1 Tax=Didymella pomorum TaxID=749634 RepID=A0A9W8Z5R0_9PLEO|nr:hypothetical protein N0V91_010241 [Didymella pomorum]
MPRKLCIQSPKGQKLKKARKGESREANGDRASRSGLFSAVDCSPRGFRVSNWTVHQPRHRHGNTGPRQGRLKSRSVPAPEDRAFFATLKREDKEEERLLLRSSRKAKVKLLKNALQKQYIDELDEDEARAKKLEEVTKLAAEKEARQG